MSIFRHCTHFQVVLMCGSGQCNSSHVVSAASSSVGVRSGMDWRRIEDLFRRCLREEKDTLCK